MRGSIFVCAVCALALVACGDDTGGGTSPEPDTGIGDVGAPDGGGDPGDAGGDGFVIPPPGEPVYISFTREVTVPGAGLPDYVQLMVTTDDCRAPATDVCGGPGTCELIEVAPRDPSEPLCNASCTLTTGLDYIVFLDPAEVRTLRAAPLGDDFQLTADSEIIATDVRDFQVQGSILAYRVNNDLHVHNLESGADDVVATFSNSNGGFYLPPTADQLFVNEVVSLTAMDTEVIPIAGGAGQPVFEFISGERQGTGSFYSGREQMSVSPDGTRLAVVTSARTSSNLCASNADCVNPGETCLASADPARCVRHDLQLHLINLDATDRLNTPCADNATCGGNHVCDLSAPDGDGQGRCIPGRFILGPSGPTACQTIADGEYEDIRPTLAWRSADEVIAVLTQECNTGNIPVTDIVAFNFSNGAVDRVVENPAQDHGLCNDPVEQCYDASECNVEISQAAISATGRTVAFVADSVSTRQKNELWVIDAFGQTGKALLTRSIDYEILSVRVHPRD